MPEPIGFSSATRQLAELVATVPDELMEAPTPCERYTVADLLDHLAGLSVAFAMAAMKQTGGVTAEPPHADGSQLVTQWRIQIPTLLDDLAVAWSSPSAWTGMTQVGGVNLPAETTGTIALGEVVLHGWDLARATGQPFIAAADLVEHCIGFVSSTAKPEDAAAREGIFGPPVAVPAGAPAIDHLLGLSGRDPGWRPPR